VLWYAREILPQCAHGCRRQDDDRGQWCRADQALAADDFVVAGYVPDVAPYLPQARDLDSPLRYGAGVKARSTSR
jgi:hypothetical protein